MTTPQTGFTFNLPTAATTTSAPTLNFGSGGTSTGFSFGNTNLNKSSTVTTSTGLSLGSLPSSTATQNTSFNLTSTLTSQPQGTSFSFGGATSTPATTASSEKKTVTFNLPSVSTPQLGATSSQPGNISTGLTTNLQGMTFAELEENVNKWHIMMDEQQRLFYNKVNELNATEKLLYENRVKLEKLNSITEEATARQKALNDELNFVGQLQKELDESVTSLEKQIEKVEGDIPADTERAQTYKLADTLDLQIKKMNEELKEIIENTNEQNKCQDLSDPIVQIGRIINAQINTMSKLTQRVTEFNKDIDTINNIQKKL